jgi:hypothetical protein
VKYHEDRKKLFSINNATKLKQELKLPKIPSNESEATTKYVYRVKVKTKQHGQLQMQKKKPGRKRQRMKSILRGSNVQT